MQFYCLLLQNRSAQDAAGVTNHECHSLGCGLARSHDEIALVFAVVVIDHHDHFTLSNRGESFFDGVKNSWVGVVAHGLVALSKTVRETSTGKYVQTVMARVT